MAKPILIFDAIFEDMSIDLTGKIFDYPKHDDLELWINSPGGSVPAGYSMLAALDQRKKDTKKENNMTVVGDASSMAFIMLLFADNTRAYDSANFLVHRAASWWEEIMTDEELADIEQRNKVIRAKMNERLDEAKFIEVTGKSFDEIFSMKERLDVRLTAKQAKEIGLIDEIIKLNPRKMQEVESRYYNEIAALASNSITNSNKQKKNMGLFSKTKDPVFLATVNDKQVVYSKLEIGESVKAIGNEDVAISGTFEKDNKEVTVVENEITAVKEVNENSKRIVALEDKVGVLISTVEKMVDAKEDTPIADEKENETIKALEEKVSQLSDVIAKAKLSVSNPILPKAEFKEGAPIETKSAKKRFKNELKEGNK